MKYLALFFKTQRPQIIAGLVVAFYFLTRILISIF
jgi:hypothetical protein